MRVWLASGSPRREELLGWCGVDVDVRPSDVDETQRLDEDPVAYAERLAGSKAAVAPEDRLTVAADTVVHLDGAVLGKPADRSEAEAFLARLSGGWHTVTTGCCVRRGATQRVWHCSTAVRFRPLTAGEIADYAATGEGDDKAGSYAIQGRGGALVAEVRGSWTNVKGLPVEEILPALRDLGWTP